MEEIELFKSKVFILGAGASVDYGLPTWKELSSLIKEKVLKIENEKYKEDIIRWMDLVGENKKYSTIDECIYNESLSEVHRENGFDIEVKIFDSLLKEILLEKYNKNEREGWLKDLNENIRINKINLDNLYFINLNYDNVLEDKFLNYNYLLQKESVLYRERLLKLNSVKNQHDYNKPQCLYPYGCFDYGNNRGYINKVSSTIKDFDETISNCVVCNDSKKFNIQNKNSLSIYIMGVGGALELLFSNIIFTNLKRIKDIHITVKQDENENNNDYSSRITNIKNFLGNKLEINIENIYHYKDCRDLIQNAF